jgi:hypothetical protein
MLRQLLVGGLVSVINIAIHALFMTAVISIARRAGATKATGHLALIAIMIGTVSTIMIAHTCEVMVWALAYHIVDAAPPAARLVYFAFVNYTTLGYGDVVPVERWQLLGPIAAMNGILMFGWSTAVIFEVLRRALARHSGFASH